MDIPLVNRGHAGCDDPSSQHHGSRTSRDSHARAPQRHRSNGGGGGGGDSEMVLPEVAAWLGLSFMELDTRNARLVFAHSTHRQPP